MPTDPLLIDIEQLGIVGGKDVPPGTLVLRDAAHGGNPHFIFDDPEDDEPANYIAELGKTSRGMFWASRLPHSSYWLAAREWRIIVDPASSYMGVSDSAAAGDAFILRGQPGFVATWNHRQIFLGKAGSMVPSPGFGGDYVGFRKWRIVIEGRVPADRRIVAEFSR